MLQMLFLCVLALSVFAAQIKGEAGNITDKSLALPLGELSPKVTERASYFYIRIFWAALAMDASNATRRVSSIWPQ